MNKEKQIEEMAECCPYFWNGACTVDAIKPTDCDLMCEMFGFMTSLVNAGYRKQSEGEWVRQEKILGKVIPEAVCSICGRDVTYQVIDNKWEFENYCSHCGAKMKGENNE